MKKQGILNSEIAKVLADMGHTDTLCIGDCGLPVPADVKKIDLAIQLGEPSFIEVLKAVSDDMQLEKITLAEEIQAANPQVLAHIQEIFPGLETGFIRHEALKQQLHRARAVIRTGEATPYANILLHSGVNF